MKADDYYKITARLRSVGIEEFRPHRIDNEYAGVRVDIDDKTYIDILESIQGWLISYKGETVSTCLTTWELHIDHIEGDLQCFAFIGGKDQEGVMIKL